MTLVRVALIHSRVRTLANFQKRSSSSRSKCRCKHTLVCNIQRFTL